MVHHYVNRIAAVVYQWCGFESRWRKNNKKFEDSKGVVIRRRGWMDRQLNDRENMGCWSGSSKRTCIHVLRYQFCLCFCDFDWILELFWRCGILFLFEFNFYSLKTTLLFQYICYLKRDSDVNEDDRQSITLYSTFWACFLCVIM